MAYFLKAGIEISLNGTTWYRLTDHNRNVIDITPTLIEKESRMADGTLRKYVVAKKNVISTSWTFVPAKSSCIADGNYGGSWLTSFYNANCFVPIQVRVIQATHTDPTIGTAPTDSTYVAAQSVQAVQGNTGYRSYSAFITNFSSSIVNRTRETDYLDISIEFTEI